MSQRVDILLVDDHEENLLALEAILVDPSFNLVRASSGRAALKEVLRCDFALILLDVAMPDLDGYETAELIRSCVAEVHVEESQRRLIAQADGLADVARLAQLLQDNAIEVDDLGLKRPSLDDVFLHLTGHRAEQEEDQDEERDSDSDAAEPSGDDTREREEALR